MQPSPEALDALIQQALDEDLADQGDITTTSTISTKKTAKAIMRTRSAGVIAGVNVATRVFEMVDPSLHVETHKSCGDIVKASDDILTIEGAARSILIAERTALNFITHLSGIATTTAQYVEAVKGTEAKILDTRKTLPGLRALQKYAVKAGGGVNHRFGLYDAILIKDNHIAVAGGIKQALEAVGDQKGTVKIEIEVDTLEQLEEVLSSDVADVVMLDNMDTGTLEKAVVLIDGRVLCEASGGVNLDTVSGIAKTGVDYISVGALTHSVIGLDIGLDIKVH